jgi:hypothetical protein
MAAPERGEPARHQQAAAVVGGHGGHAAVAAAVSEPLSHGVAELVAGRFPGNDLGPLRLVRSKYKPRHKLTGYYVAESRRAGRQHLAVTWHADGNVELMAAPDDPAMPQLSGLVDAGRLGALVAECSGRPFAKDPVVVIFRYRPGQRHVLLARYADAAVHVKTDRDGSGARAVPTAQLLGTALARSAGDTAVAEPIGYLPTIRTSLWWHAAGRPVAPMLVAGNSATPVAEHVGRLARQVHEVAGRTGRHPALRSLPRRDLRAEATATLRAGEHIAELLPDVWSVYTATLAAVVESLDRLPAEAPSLVHGDLKADNLLLDEDRLRVLDLDRASWAEPALDLGKFLADLRWWSPTVESAAALAAAFRTGYGACDPVRWTRAELLASMLELKLAARRYPVHDARWPALVASRVTRTARRPVELAGSR